MEAKETKRDEIVRHAYRIFYEHGFHATGVDRLFEDTGISKRTVYKYFRSKEALISAAVDYYNQKTFQAMGEEIEKRGKTPRDKILAIFDIRREILENGDFTGCFAINAKLEYEGKNKEIEAACANFAKGVENVLEQLCAAAGVKNPQPLARQLMILVQGTIVYGQSSRDASVAASAKDMAKMLLDQAIGKPAKTRKRA